MRASWLRTKTYTKVVSLRVSAAPAGAAISLTCSGKKVGCPFAKKTYKIGPSGAVTLTNAFKSAKLKPGAHLQLRITRAGATGKVVDFTVRKLKLPQVTIRCLPPGASTPKAC